MPLKPALDAIAENRMLAVWARHFRRHPDQVNGMHETDAELIPLPGSDQLLAITTDTVAEEIEAGLYTDPDTIGWMAGTVSLSDLAAVAAAPLGLVAAVTLPWEAPPGFQAGVAAGLDAACLAAGTYVLGGDTNVGEQATVTTTALGLVPRGRALGRKGCGPGEVVYASGPLGAGACLAARALAQPGPRPADGACFRPRARIAEAQRLVGFATACMDTSDGLIATLDQLARLNGVGFEITAPLDTLVEARARLVCSELGVDPLLALAQPHGEFELVWTVRATAQVAFERHARAHGLEPLLLGRTISQPVVRLAGDPGRVIDAARFRNLECAADGDLRRYFAALCAALEGGNA